MRGQKPTARPSRDKLLVIMAKEPVPGRVKTRLQPHLSAEDAAALYSSFLEDRIAAMKGLEDTDVAIAYAPESAYGVFARLAPREFILIPQRGRDLGERLTQIFSSQLMRGYDAVSIIESDSPDLPGAFVLEAFRLLDMGSDIVYGPCPDGGYYLVGMKDIRPGTFEGVPWSTSGVFKKSLENAAALGIKVELLPQWRDIDTFDDLRDYYYRWKRATPGVYPRAGASLSRIEKLLRAGTLRFDE